MAPRQQSNQPKTTLYHSELVKAGEVQITVIEERKQSKFRGKPDYAVIRLEGRNRNYEFENDGCGDFFEGQTGVTMVILAEGSREDATLTYIGEGSTDDRGEEPPPARPPARKPAGRAQGAPPARTAQPPARESSAPPARQSAPARGQTGGTGQTTTQAPKRTEETPAQRVQRARVHAAKVANVWLIAFQAATYARREAEEQLGQKVNDDQFRACVSTICVQLEKDGFHHLMPASALNLNPKTEPSAPPKENKPAEPSDNDGGTGDEAGAGD